MANKDDDSHLSGNVIPFGDYQNSEAVADSALKFSDGGGTFDGMEPRIAKLEADMDHVKRDITLMQGDLRLIAEGIGGKGGLREASATMAERISALPSKDWISTRVTWSVGLIVAAIAITGAILKLIS